MRIMQYYRNNSASFNPQGEGSDNKFPKNSPEFEESVPGEKGGSPGEFSSGSLGLQRGRGEPTLLDWAFPITSP
jgi:hypothetical protein